MTMWLIAGGAGTFSVASDSTDFDHIGLTSRQPEECSHIPVALLSGEARQLQFRMHP